MATKRSKQPSPRQALGKTTANRPANRTRPASSVRETSDLSTRPTNLVTMIFAATVNRAPASYLRNGAEAHREIQRGFGIHEFEAFLDHSQLPPELVRQVVQLPARTYQRRKIEGRLSSTESDRLWRLVRLFAQAQALFQGDPGAAAEWMQRPVPGLGDSTPCEMAETEVGAREVENLIGRLEHGVFS